MNLALIRAKIHIVRLILKPVASSPKCLHLCFPLLCPPPRSYRAGRLRAPCRLMLTGMLNDLRGDAVLRNMAPPVRAPSRSRSRWSTLCLEAARPTVVQGRRLCPGQIAARSPGKRPVVYRGSKVSAFRPAARCHGNRPAGEAGRMLISSRQTAGAPAATCCPSKSLFNDSHLMLHTRARVPVTLKAPLPPPPPSPISSCRGGRC